MSEFNAYGMEPKMPLWARILGARYWDGDGSVRTRIGEISYRSRGLAFDFGSYGEPHLHIGLFFFAWFMPLPRWTDRFFRGSNSIERDRYGFSWRWSDGCSLHLHWGQRVKVIWMPWQLEHIRTDYLGVDLRWHDDKVKPGSWRNPLEPGPEPWSEVHPYHYMLDSGEVQTVDATITRRRAYHGRMWLGPKWLRRWLRSVLPKQCFDSIDVQFSDEVGARRGSWKGGCVGCSYDIKPEESPKAALYRMQRERRFR